MLYLCQFVSKTDTGLKIHVGKAHKAQELPPSPATPAPAPATSAAPAPARAPAPLRVLPAPTKTMYYHPKDVCPPHVPPPPGCKTCGKATTWTASRRKHNMSWLNEFACTSCTDHTRSGLSTRTTLTTAPLPKLTV